MRKKILVTGASGFSGHLISSYLVKKKNKVTNIVYRNIKCKRDKSINLIKKINLNINFDWIVHIAAHHKISDFENNPKVKAKRNVLMVQNLINFSKEKNIKNFIYFSTVDINYSTFPPKKDIYIKSKIFCEKILISALKKNILNKLIILRLPAIVGKQSNENFIKNTLINMKSNKPVNIWNKNSNYNNLIHINDLKRLIFHFISKKYKKRKIIVDCLASKPIKLFNLITFLKQKLKSKSKINFIEKKNKSKKIEYNSINNYKFFNVKKTISLLI